MSLLSLAAVKNQLRLDAADVSEDDYLTTLALVVSESVSNEINRKLYATQAELDADVTALTAPDGSMVVTEGLRHAMLLLVGHYYNNRETTTTENIRQMPLAFRHLTNPYRLINL